MKFSQVCLTVATALAFVEGLSAEDDLDNFFNNLFGFFGNNDEISDKDSVTNNPIEGDESENLLNQGSVSDSLDSAESSHNSGDSYNLTTTGEDQSQNETTTEDTSLRSSSVSNGGDAMTESNILETTTARTPTTATATKDGLWANLFGSSDVDDSAISTTTQSPAKAEAPAVCKDNPDLSEYCIIPTSLEGYLQQNYTIEYLSQRIFNCSVVDKLMKQCKLGEWCLPSQYVYNFMQLSDAFFGGPICSSGLRSCLEIVNQDQQGCVKSNEIYNMHVALDLLCELGNQKGLTYECFGHVMAMLHVNLADALRVPLISNDDSNPTACDIQEAQLIKRYICIRDLCTYQTDMLSSFEPWQWFMGDATSYEEMCRYTDVCGLENRDNSTTTPATTTMVTTTMTPPLQLVTEVPEVNHDVVEENKDNSDIGVPYEHNPSSVMDISDTRMLVGVSTAVVIASFGLTVLVCTLWKKINRHNKRYNPSYTQLSSEEIQPLYH